MPDDTKPAAAPRQRNRFTIMEAVVRDFISLTPNDREWVRKEIAAKEEAEKASPAGTPPAPSSVESQG